MKIAFCSPGFGIQIMLLQRELLFERAFHELSIYGDVDLLFEHPF